MAKTSTSSAGSPSRFVPGVPILTSHLREVMEALNYARGSEPRNLFSWAAGTGWAGGAEVSPSMDSFEQDTQITATGVVLKTQVYIDPDFTDLVGKVLFAIGATANPACTVNMTLGGVTQTVNLGTSTPIGTLFFSLSTVPTGWQELTVTVTKSAAVSIEPIAISLRTDVIAPTDFEDPL